MKYALSRNTALSDYFEGGIQMLQTMGKQWIAGCLLAAAFVGSASAHDAGTAKGSEAANTEEMTLGEIVVTATRTEQDLADAPGSVAVVTREALEKRPVTTIDEALNTVPGVITTRGKGMMDRMSAITLRGIPGQSRTLVMLDGITLNSPYSGSVLSVGIAPGSLERVEVVKGPASSLYGGFAMGGAVNLITRMPDTREIDLSIGFGSSLASDNGMENTRRVTVSCGDRLAGKFRIFIHNDYLATDGYRTDANIQSSRPPVGIAGWEPTTDYTGATRYRLGNKGQNGAWQDNFTLKTELEAASETRLRFNFIKSTGEYSYDSPATYLRNAAGAGVWSYGTVREASFMAGNGGSDQHLFALSGETVLASVLLKMNLGYLDQVTGWSITPTSAAPPNGATRNSGPGKLSDTPAVAVNLDLQGSLPILEKHLLTVGASFRTGWAVSSEYRLFDWRDENSRGALTYEAKGSDRVFALFAEGEIALTDKLTLFAGFRQDWWETFDGYVNQPGTSGYPISYDTRKASSFNPRGAIVYKPFERTTFKVSGGRAFRAPTVYELYRTWTTSSGTTCAGNPDLKPETTLSWDAGISQGLWNGAKVSATYFENYISDLIYTTSTTATRKEKVNAGRAESKGVELEAEQGFGSLLRLFANYTYTDAVIRENNAAPASVGKRMTDVPEQMFNLGADLEYGAFGAAATGRYVGKRYATDDNKDTLNGVHGSYDPYFTVDLKMRYRITPSATASFSITNLFDRRYYSNALAPGRSCFGELSFKF